MVMRVPSIDAQIGITLYLTKSEGVGGFIRGSVEDFYVEELTNRIESSAGKYLILELTKRNWDTHRLVHDLARILRISKERIAWAGTKDKRAVTKQKISIWDIAEEDVQRIRLRDVELKPVGRSNRKISLGDLWGNRFKIILRGIDLPLEVARNQIEAITCEILEARGAPNFFGIQRFGEMRPVTHLVGEAIVRGNPGEAALTYIGKSFPEEPPEIRMARQQVYDTRDYKAGLELFPVFLQYERAVLNHLVKNPEDYIGALRVLSFNLRKLFVHAYQSYLFNLILSKRLESGLPLNQALEGDIVCFKNEVGLPDVTRLQRVKADNLAGINNLLRLGRAFVTAPLIGYETEFAESTPGEIEHSIVEENKVDLEGFKVPMIPELASKGIRREIILPVAPSIQVMGDDKTEAVFEFTLPKGGYATTLLREYMKS